MTQQTDPRGRLWTPRRSWTPRGQVVADLLVDEFRDWQRDDLIAARREVEQFVSHIDPDDVRESRSRVGMFQ